MEPIRSGAGCGAGAEDVVSTSLLLLSETETARELYPIQGNGRPSFKNKYAPVYQCPLPDICAETIANTVKVTGVSNDKAVNEVKIALPKALSAEAVPNLSSDKRDEFKRLIAIADTIIKNYNTTQHDAIVAAEEYNQLSDDEDDALEKKGKDMQNLCVRNCLQLFDLQRTFTQMDALIAENDLITTDPSLCDAIPFFPRKVGNALCPFFKREKAPDNLAGINISTGTQDLSYNVLQFLPESSQAVYKDALDSARTLREQYNKNMQSARALYYEALENPTEALSKGIQIQTLCAESYQIAKQFKRLSDTVLVPIQKEYDNIKRWIHPLQEQETRGELPTDYLMTLSAAMDSYLSRGDGNIHRETRLRTALSACFTTLDYDARPVESFCCLASCQILTQPAPFALIRLPFSQKEVFLTQDQITQYNTAFDLAVSLTTDYVHNLRALQRLGNDLTRSSELLASAKKQKSQEMIGLHIKNCKLLTELKNNIYPILQTLGDEARKLHQEKAFSVPFNVPTITNYDPSRPLCKFKEPSRD